MSGNGSRWPRRILRRAADAMLDPLLVPLGYRRAETPAAESAIPTSRFYADESSFSAMTAVHRHFLSDSGWLETKHLNAPKRQGEYIPWITYPALHVLERLDLGPLKVLEFGAGASSPFFMKRCQQLTSYEFDGEYFSSIERAFSSPHILRGVNQFSRDLTNGAPEMVPSDALEVDLAHDPRLAIVDFDHFRRLALQDIDGADLVLIDGGPRNYIAQVVGESNARPAVILDNADWDHCGLAIQCLLKAGYTEIPFRGLGPLNPYQWTTSLFETSLDQFRFPIPKTAA